MKLMKKILFGNEVERMPDLAFRMIKVFFNIYYFFRPPLKYLEKFGIKRGDKIVDYGCGPGAFIKDASRLVGNDGIVYAADIHEIAITTIEKLISDLSLTNVIPVLTQGNRSGIADETADLIYALDMFHMVKDTDSFLKELNCIIKEDGHLILEDGHQPRAVTKVKISRSGFWKIAEEQKRFLRCTPVKHKS